MTSHAKRGCTLPLIFIAVVLVRNIYRPWAREHNVLDFGLAGWGPSFFLFCGISIAMCYALGIWVRTRERKWIVPLILVVAGAAYEVLQLFTHLRTFDVADIVASAGGSVLGFLLDKWIETDPGKDRAEPTDAGDKQWPR